MPDPSKHLRGMLLTAFGVLVLTPDALLIRLIEADVWTLLFWRGLLQFLALVLYYAVVFRTRALREFCSAGIMGGIIACMYVAGNMMFIHSIRLTTTANTLLIISSAPIMAAILSRFLLREQTALRTWLAATVCMLGVVIIFSGGFSAGSVIGDSLALVSALSMAATFVLIRKVHLTSMVPAVAISGLLMAIIAAPVAPTLSTSAQDFRYLFLLGAIIMPIAFGLITLGPRYIPAPEVTLIMLIETVLGPTWVWLVLDERPPMTTFAGGGLILAALAVHSVLTLRSSGQVSSK